MSIQQRFEPNNSFNVGRAIYENRQQSLVIYLFFINYNSSWRIQKLYLPLDRYHLLAYPHQL